MLRGEVDPVEKMRMKAQSHLLSKLRTGVLKVTLSQADAPWKKVATAAKVLSTVANGRSRNCLHEDGFREEVDAQGRTIEACDMCGLRKDLCSDVRGTRHDQTCAHEDGFREHVNADGKCVEVCDACGEQRMVDDDPENVSKILGGSPSQIEAAPQSPPVSPNSKAEALHPGDDVQVWCDGQYYPGAVRRQHPDGTLRVTYKRDGATLEEVVTIDRVRHHDGQPTRHRMSINAASEAEGSPSRSTRADSIGEADFGLSDQQLAQMNLTA